MKKTFASLAILGASTLPLSAHAGFSSIFSDSFIEVLGFTDVTGAPVSGIGTTGLTVLGTNTGIPFDGAEIAAGFVDVSIDFDAVPEGPVIPDQLFSGWVGDITTNGGPFIGSAFASGSLSNFLMIKNETTDLLTAEIDWFGELDGSFDDTTGPADFSAFMEAFIIDIDISGDPSAADDDFDFLATGEDPFLVFGPGEEFIEIATRRRGSDSEEYDLSGFYDIAPGHALILGAYSELELSAATIVPLPASIWFFGAALTTLVAKRKTQAA